MKDYWKIISTWEIKIQISECIYWVFDVFCLFRYYTSYQSNAFYTLMHVCSRSISKDVFVCFLIFRSSSISFYSFCWISWSILSIFLFVCYRLLRWFYSSEYILFSSCSIFSVIFSVSCSRLFFSASMVSSSSFSFFLILTVMF